MHPLVTPRPGTLPRTGGVPLGLGDTPGLASGLRLRRGARRDEVGVMDGGDVGVCAQA
jgi:hypothetical protein